MNKLNRTITFRIAVIVAGLLLLALVAGQVSKAFAVRPVTVPQKVFVCKYVGTPGTDEHLQTGNNPISVSVNAIQNNQWNGTVPGYFSDEHDRSYVLAYDTGQATPNVSECPQPPVVDVCVNLDGNQATVPTGTWLNDKGACVQIVKCGPGTTVLDTDVHGNETCKADPTGCPYGDSIPVDSPKCVAPQDPGTNQTAHNVATDEPEVFVGK